MRCAQPSICEVLLQQEDEHCDRLLPASVVRLASASYLTMHINPDHFLQTEAGRVTTRARNNEAWRESYRAFHQALAVAGPDTRVYVLVGAPGSGKSTWAAQITRDRPRDIIFDAILVTHRERCPILAASEARGVKAIAVWFKTPLGVCLTRNASRPHDEIASEVGIRNVFAAIEPPSLLEGFDEVLEIE